VLEIIFFPPGKGDPKWQFRSRRREEADSLKDLECFFEHCANEPEAFLRQPRSEFEAKIWRQQNAPVSYPSDSIFLPLIFTARLAFISLLFLALPGLSAVREVGSIGLTVNNLDREVEFFTNVLPFVEVSRARIHGREPDALLGLQNTHLQVADLKLGQEHIILTEHLTNKGRAIPADSRSYDRWFQHIAIVVRDMDKAYEQLRQHKVKHVSTGPQTLPAWNNGAAGIKAFSFRDPEDHVLEIIFFPPGKGDPEWQFRSRRREEAEIVAEQDESASSRQRLHSLEVALFLGIDHTAIVVSDTDKSLAFYRDELGLRVTGESDNYGVEQEHLNQVFGARLHITSLRAERGPGIEFLEYITPPGGRALPADAKASDLVFWHTDLFADKFNDLASRLRERETRFVSTRLPRLPGSSADALNAVIVRDPDGHAVELIDRGESSLSSLVSPGNR